MKKVSKWCDEYLGMIIAISLFVIGGFHIISSYAGSGTLSTVSGGNVIKASHINQFVTALKQDLLPRNSSGVVTDEAGSIGDSTYKWLKAFIESGHWSAGDIKAHHTYDGTVTCGQGWMLMDGRVINETNYDAEHSAGDWDTYVVSSPLDGLYLPDMDDTYLVGADATGEDGDPAGDGDVATVGQSGHSLTVADHTHTLTAHNHVWHAGFTAAHDKTYDSGGNYVDMTSHTQTAAVWGVQMGANTAATLINVNSNISYTSKGLTSTNSSGTHSIDGQPESVEVQFCMRVIE